MFPFLNDLLEIGQKNSNSLKSPYNLKVVKQSFSTEKMLNGVKGRQHFETYLGIYYTTDMASYKRNKIHVSCN